VEVGSEEIDKRRLQLGLYIEHCGDGKVENMVIYLFSPASSKYKNSLTDVMYQRVAKRRSKEFQGDVKEEIWFYALRMASRYVF
jgi:hypothetical protein